MAFKLPPGVGGEHRTRSDGSRRRAKASRAVLLVLGVFLGIGGVSLSLVSDESLVDSAAEAAPTAQARPAPDDLLIDEDGADALMHRGWVVVPEGIYLIVSPEIALDESEPALGYLIFWWDFDRDDVYVFGELASEKFQLGRSVMTLRRDLDVDYTTLIHFDVTLNEALLMAGAFGRIEAAWSATEGERVLGILREAGAHATSGDVDRMLDSVDRMMSTLASHPNPNGGAGAPVPPGIDLGGGERGVQIPRGDDVDNIPPDMSCLCCLVPIEWYPDLIDPDEGGGRGQGGDRAECCRHGICNDGDACTVNDACGGPYGLGCFDGPCCGEPIRCQKGPCDRRAFCEGGSCVFLPKICEDDGNVCTIDECIDGVCHHPLSGPVCGTTNSFCTKAVCVDGSCSIRPDHDGLGCTDDGNPCTDDICEDGSCVHPPISGPLCADDGNDCTIDVCIAGDCEHLPTNDGAVCQEDTDPCIKYVCENGACTIEPDNEGGTCDDEPNECTDDICEDGACTHPPVPDGTGCEPDEDPCTDDICENGVCTHPSSPARNGCGEDGICCDGGGCCPAGDQCCVHMGGGCCPLETTCCGELCCLTDQACCEGDTTCCENCCDNDVCCPVECEGCIDNGSLEPTGPIVASPPAPCVGDLITFTLPPVVDTGGIERVFCTAKQPIPPAGVEYSWQATKPNGAVVSGNGRIATVLADLPGIYDITFTVTSLRLKCPPSDMQISAQVEAKPTIEEATDWLVVHDVDFERVYCQSGPTPRSKQAELHGNEALVIVDGIKRPECDFEVWLVEETPSGPEDIVAGSAVVQGEKTHFLFRTTAGASGGAKTDTEGRIYVENALLPNGPSTSAYRFELRIEKETLPDNVIESRQVTISPLLIQLRYLPDVLLNPPRTLDPYSDFHDIEGNSGPNPPGYNDGEMFGLLTRYDLNDDVEFPPKIVYYNNTDPGLRPGDIVGDYELFLNEPDAADLAQAGPNRQVKWEGFTDNGVVLENGYRESGTWVFLRGSEAELPMPFDMGNGVEQSMRGVAPFWVAREGHYWNEIRLVREAGFKEAPHMQQEQKLKVPFEVKYEIE